MIKKLRLTCIVGFFVLLCVEIFIGLFVHDGFIRPYFGDVLITLLLCFLFRAVIPKGVEFLPLFVFVFSVFVELAQYFELVKLLRLENNKLLSTIIGTSFSFIDIICYAVGCIAFVIIEKAIISFLKRR